MRKSVVAILSFIALLTANFCNAQSAFKLVCGSNILDSYSPDAREVMPFGSYKVTVTPTNQGLVIESPEFGVLRMSNNLIYNEVDVDNSVIYFLLDGDSVEGNKYTKGIIYSKNKNSSKKNPVKSDFSLMDGKKTFIWPDAVVLYFNATNKSSTADSNLALTTPNEDLLINFFRLHKK